MLRLVVIFVVVLAALAFSACPKSVGGFSREAGGDAGAASGGESNVSGDRGASEKPLKIPRNIERELDFPAEYVLKEVVDSRTSGKVVYAVNPPRTEEIIRFHIGDLESKGYHSDDNPSRILEGVTFTGGAYRSVYIRVTEDYKEGTVVTIEVEY
ncbi:MAG: hypothetical protein HRF49_08385 [bacterium]|jgi:hypothetical protein